MPRHSKHVLLGYSKILNGCGPWCIETMIIMISMREWIDEKSLLKVKLPSNDNIKEDRKLPNTIERVIGFFPYAEWEWCDRCYVTTIHTLPIVFRFGMCILKHNTSAFWNGVRTWFSTLILTFEKVESNIIKRLIQHYKTFILNILSALY